MYNLKIVLSALFLMSCFSFLSKTVVSNDSVLTEVKSSEVLAYHDTLNIQGKKIYIPNDLKNNDFLDTSSTWCYQRSRYSENFIVFWDKKYEDKDPGSTEVPEKYRVNVDSLLLKAEEFFSINVNQLKFTEIGKGTSRIDTFRMEIFLFYQDNWMATGAGWDDVIGALWVSTATCQPVASVIAHEIGHSFQYQVNCDLGNNSGFRYGFGEDGSGGNGFWEQTAQWQSLQSYPEEIFSKHHFPNYCNNAFRHICHEDFRYASYFIHYYWTQKHGIDFIGKLWREARRPEDPMQAYMRITNISTEEFNNEIYEASTMFVTWDLDELRNYATQFIGKQNFSMDKQDNGFYKIAYEKCPGTTGYNVVPLEVPDAGTEIAIDFEGLVNAEGYNQVKDASRANWRYGFVALLSNNQREYGNMHKGAKNTVKFTVPENCNRLWFVITGAPNTYAPHAWDDDNTNDDQWPYQIKISNSEVIGIVPIGKDINIENNELSYDVSFKFSDSEYPGTSVQVNTEEIAKKLKLTVSEIQNKLGNEINFYALQSNGKLTAKNTTRGTGHWFNAKGDVCDHGDMAMVFSEFNSDQFTFSVGQYPGHCKVGDTFVVKQALLYKIDQKNYTQLTFAFNITLE